MTVTLASVLILIGICITGFCEIDEVLKKILDAMEKK